MRAAIRPLPSRNAWLARTRVGICTIISRPPQAALRGTSVNPPPHRLSADIYVLTTNACRPPHVHVPLTGPRRPLTPYALHWGGARASNSRRSPPGCSRVWHPDRLRHHAKGFSLTRALHSTEAFPATSTSPSAEGPIWVLEPEAPDRPSHKHRKARPVTRALAPIQGPPAGSPSSEIDTGRARSSSSGSNT